MISRPPTENKLALTKKLRREPDIMNDVPTNDHVWTLVILSLTIGIIEDRKGVQLKKFDTERLAAHLITKRIVDIVDLTED